MDNRYCSNGTLLRKDFEKLIAIGKKANTHNTSPSEETKMNLRLNLKNKIK